jgi:hypothetical protein
MGKADGQAVDGPIQPQLAADVDQVSELLDLLRH